MQCYHFTVEGKIKGKDRPRFFRGHAYTPKETKEYEKLVASKYEGEKIKGQVKVEITAHYKIPKSTTKKALLEIKNGKLPQVKPDIDNILKIVLDSLNGVAYEDDKQVTSITANKCYAIDGNERIEVIVSGV